MFDVTTFALFLAAASAVAFAPGPGLLFVLARTLAEGRAVGLSSTLGTVIGGLVHVIAGAVGVSAIVYASAEVFTIVKLLGAGYLIWLGVRTIRAAGSAAAELTSFEPEATADPKPSHGSKSNPIKRAIRDGIVVEALNPKTALFFLAFLPQFISPEAGSIWLQFVILGSISIVLNAVADITIAVSAGSVRSALLTRPLLTRRIQQTSGGLLCTLGVSVAATGRA